MDQDIVSSGSYPLYDALMREYHPTWGRWLSPDPLGGDITNPQSLNRYAYVGNNPTSFVDPLGLCKARGLDYPGPCGYLGSPVVEAVDAYNQCLEEGDCVPD